MRPKYIQISGKTRRFFLRHFRDPASANENANDAIASDRIEMKTGCSPDIQRDGSVACIPIGRS